MGLGHSPRIVTDGLVMCLDAANQKSFSPNVFPGALDLYTWYVTRRGSNIGNACTVAQDNSTSKSPAGGIPMRMDVTGTDPYIISYNSAPWNISAASNSQTWTLSVYVKGSVATTSRLFLFGADSTGASYVGGDWLGIAGKNINITTEWVRHDLSITFNNASIAYIHVRLDGPYSGGTGQSIWWDGLQLELGSSPTTFNPRLNTNRLNILDLSGTERSGTLTNYPDFSADKLGSLSFNGVNQRVATPSTTINYTNGGTFETWIKFNSISVNQGFLTHNNPNPWINLYMPGASAPGKVRWEVYNVTTGVGGNFLSNQTLSVSTWYHIVGTFNTSFVSSLYINGALDREVTYTGIPASSTAVIYVGSFDTTLPSNSNIAIAKIYNRALTAAEIQQNFNALRGRFGL